MGDFSNYPLQSCRFSSETHIFLVASLEPELNVTPRVYLSLEGESLSMCLLARKCGSVRSCQKNRISSRAEAENILAH